MIGYEILLGVGVLLSFCLCLWIATYRPVVYIGYPGFTTFHEYAMSLNGIGFLLLIVNIAVIAGSKDVNFAKESLRFFGGMGLLICIYFLLTLCLRPSRIKASDEIQTGWWFNCGDLKYYSGTIDKDINPHFADILWIPGEVKLTFDWLYTRLSEKKCFDSVSSASDYFIGFSVIVRTTPDCKTPERFRELVREIKSGTRKILAGIEPIGYRDCQNVCSQISDEITSILPSTQIPEVVVRSTDFCAFKDFDDVKIEFN